MKRMSRALIARKIGLIGGMRCESTVRYSKSINREVSRRLGALQAASLATISLNLENIAAQQQADNWSGVVATLAEAGHQLQQVGAECVLLATTTMHCVAEEVQSAIRVPLLNIVDVTARAVLRAGLQRVGLLGSRHTMEQSFYRDRLAIYGIECIIPQEADRDIVQRIICDQRSHHPNQERSQRGLQEIVHALSRSGAQGVVLGCAELPTWVDTTESDFPAFDATELHATAAAEFSLLPRH